MNAKYIIAAVVVVVVIALGYAVMHGSSGGPDVPAVGDHAGGNSQQGTSN